MLENIIQLKEQDARLPLVTFAIFTFNQEKLVREAVEAAFAQTYEPMEIILSDDCSSDRTLEILQTMARDYRGLKHVIVRQTKSNCGTLLHVAEVAKLAHGELLVLAAGDDVSKPERTERLVVEWQKTGAWGLFSKFDTINDHGAIMQKDLEMEQFSAPMQRLRQYFALTDPHFNFCHGATSAYDRRIFDKLTATGLSKADYVLSEDGALSILIALAGRSVAKVDTSLVLYRSSENSLTNGKKDRYKLSDIKHDELCIERLAKSQANRCALFIRLNQYFQKNGVSQLNSELLGEDMLRLNIRADWRNLNLLARLSYILSQKCTPSDLKWAVPRILSVRLFIILKTLFRTGMRLLRYLRPFSQSPL